MLFLSSLSAIKAQNQLFNDPAITEINTEPAHANFVPYLNGNDAVEEGSTELVKLLNGKWNFKMVVGKDKIPSDYQLTSFNDSNWDKITVPSNWQRQGFGMPVYSNATLDMEPDEVGLYRHEIKIDRIEDNKRYFLKFEGVKTAYTLYINGENAGYAEGAYLPSEFDITNFLKKGKNLIAVTVYRVVDIQRIENFDTWRLSGIFRDVKLITRPDTYIEDIEILANAINNYKDGEFTLKAIIKNKAKRSAKGYKILVKLLLEGKSLFETTLDLPKISKNRDTEIKINKTFKNVKLWSAEAPNLYKTVVELRKNKKSVEATAINTGFRTIEIIDQQIKVNGKKIYFKGVNRHDWHPDMGRAITKEIMEKDMLMFKKYNINSIRTAHYPNDSYLYELADKLGIYIMDEAAMETHWVTHAEEEKGFEKPHVSRIERLIERDKNYPSVIMWSLGNEFHIGTHTKTMYNRALKRDPSRLIYCDGDPKIETLDVLPSAYQSLDGIKKTSQKGKPVVMKEYMHAAGNEMGLFSNLWDIIRSPEYKNLHGGFIWDWKDQGWTIKRNGKSDYYDWGEDSGVAPTGNDCYDGITDTDMNEVPKLLEVAKVFQDIKVVIANKPKKTFKVINRHSFIPLNNFKTEWILYKNGVKIASEPIKQLTTEAGKSEIVKPNLDKYISNVKPEDDIQILFRFHTIKPMPGIPSNHLYAWDQIELKQGFVKPESNPVGSRITHTKSDKSFTIRTRNSEFIFNTTVGRFISWKQDGKEMIDRTQGPTINLWRAVTDADNSNWGGLQSKYYRPWIKLGINDPEYIEHRVNSVKLVENTDEKVVYDISMRMSLTKENLAQIHYRYTFTADGKLTIGVNFLPGEEMQKLAGLPRIGLTTHFKKEFNNINWFGMGPHENYRDRMTSSKIALYKDKAENMYQEYVPAQANGNRAEVRWMSISNGKNGLKVYRLSSLNSNSNLNTYLPESKLLTQQSKKYFEFTAIPYTESELDVVTHAKDLPNSDRVVLTIDHEHAGVASHPRPGRLPEHEVKPVQKSFILVFEELDYN